MSWWLPWQATRIKLFVDNTGLHSSGLALDCAVRSESDLRDLLQLGILFVLADEVHWTSVEPDAVVRRSSEIAEKLRAIGAPRALLKTSNDQGEYNRCAAESASAVADDLSIGFELTDLEATMLNPTQIDADLLAANPEWLQVALAYEGSIDYAALNREFRSQKSAGVTALMVTQSALLRQALRKIYAETATWTGIHAVQLDAFLRNARNHVQARRLGASYVPGVVRAELVRDRNRQIVDNVAAQISREVDDIASELRGTPLPLPALAAAMVERSLGEPDGIIKPDYPGVSAVLPQTLAMTFEQQDRGGGRWRATRCNSRRA